MAKQCIRFAKLVLEYLGTTESNDPLDFSNYLRYSKSKSYHDLLFITGMPGIMKMVYHTRHQLRKAMKKPDWDKTAHYVQYLLDKPYDLLAHHEHANIFGDLPKQPIKGGGFFDSYFATMEKNKPVEKTAYSSHGLFKDGTIPSVLGDDDKPRPVKKPISRITHPAPRTLQ